MRTVRDPQIKFGEVDIAAIELDLKSRDDISPILRGLQYIYTTPELREAVFKILARVIPSRNGPELTNEQRHQKAVPSSWASRDGAVEDPGTRHVAPGPQHQLRPCP